MYSPDDARESHAKYCPCTPVWKQTDTGQALACGDDGAFIWWPTVDASQLTPVQQIALFVAGPMSYDSDGDHANDLLIGLGFHQITPENFDEARKALKGEYEQLLWQENVGKQLLGRLMDGDLEGDEK